MSTTAEPDLTQDLAPASDFERRDHSDRRRRPTPMLSRYTFFGRRRGARRRAEEASIYVDRPGGHAVLMLFLVLLLSFIDAIFTLRHLAMGGQEANPLMERALRMGPVTFFAVKTVLTFAGMLLLVFHKNFRGVKGAMSGVVALYAALTAYHLWLLAAL